MKEAIRVGILVLALSAAAQQPQQQSARVPDAATALKIALPKLENRYGKKVIESGQPFTAVLQGDVWFVRGTLCSGCVGGVAQMRLRQRDGKVLSMLLTF